MLDDKHRFFTNLYGVLDGSLKGGWRAPKLADVVDGPRAHDNNFDAIRWIAASIVLFSHSFPIVYGDSDREPIYIFTSGEMTGGEIAVSIFFFVSGFLITMSCQRTRTVTRFFWKRLLRLFPGLFAVTLLTVLIVGPALTTEPTGSYFADDVTARYLGNIVLLPTYALPGVFTDNPYEHTVNGSLWTLRYEFACYTLVGLLAALGFLRRWVVLVIWLVAMAIFVIPGATEMLPRGGVGGVTVKLIELYRFFGAGMVAWLYRDRIPVNGRAGVLAAAAVVVAMAFGRLGGEALVVLGGYAILCTAYVAPSFLTFATRHGDWSYGIYVYAFLIQQITMDLAPWIDAWWINALIAYPVTLVAAALSWNMIERRALSYKSVLFSGPSKSPATSASGEEK